MPGIDRKRHLGAAAREVRLAGAYRAADAPRSRHYSFVTADRPGKRGADVGFAERLLEVIDFGRRTATYKLALLMALLDLCARHSDTKGRAPALLYTRDIAEQVAALYWPQVIPYRLPGLAVQLLPGAGDELVRLGPVIRPLIELHWARMVAEINGVAQEELDLHRHLFGSDRVIPPKALREGIAALQDNRCFYCHGVLGLAPQADHFLPRVRCGIDAVENLVLADRRCNNDKRDLLPGPPHVTAWARRNEHNALALVELATASRWDTDPQATVAVARSIYSHLPQSGTPLWLGFKDVRKVDPATVLAALLPGPGLHGRTPSLIRQRTAYSFRPAALTAGRNCIQFVE